MIDPHTFIGGPLDGQVRDMVGTRWCDCPVMPECGGIYAVRYERRTVWDGATPRYEYVTEYPTIERAPVAQLSSSC